MKNKFICSVAAKQIFICLLLSFQLLIQKETASLPVAKCHGLSCLVMLTSWWIWKQQNTAGVEVLTDLLAGLLLLMHRDVKLLHFLFMIIPPFLSFLISDQASIPAYGWMELIGPLKLGP